MKRGKSLWLAVTADKYELPLSVRESKCELAQALGLWPSQITRRIERQKTDATVKDYYIREVAL